MRKAEFIKKLDKMKIVSHRLGYAMTEYPENSLKVLEIIFNERELLNSCDGFEFDICFTKDLVPVVVHDKYIDDYTAKEGLIKDFNLSELQELNFGFRKSLKLDHEYNFKILTLDDILTFFSERKSQLKDKIIKIETKDLVLFNKSNMHSLANILNKYNDLSNNIVHLSYWPTNLLTLKKIQLKNNYYVNQNDMLCDFGFQVWLSKIIKNIDSLSLRVKSKIDRLKDENNSKRVNKKIKKDIFWMRYSNVINDRVLKYAINKYGKVNLYTVDSLNEIEEIAKNLSFDFLNANSSKITITSNNPKFLKDLIKKEN